MGSRATGIGFVLFFRSSTALWIMNRLMRLSDFRLCQIYFMIYKSLYIIFVYILGIYLFEETKGKFISVFG